MINYIEYVDKIVDDLVMMAPETVEHEGISCVVDIEEVHKTLREAHANDVIGIFDHLYDLRHVHGAKVMLLDLLDYLELDEQHPDHEQLTNWVAQHKLYT